MVKKRPYLWRLTVYYNDGGQPTNDTADSEGEAQDKVRVWKTFKNVKKVKVTPLYPKE